MLQNVGLGILIDYSGFSISIEGCWQQREINTKSQPVSMSKTLQDTHGRDNKSSGFLHYSENGQVGL